MRSRTLRWGPGRTGTTLVAVAATAALLTGCASAVQGGSLAEQLDPVDLSGQSYAVGGKNSDDHLVLCEIAIAVLLSVGANVDERCGLGDAQANRDALLRGDIDLYWENTGTAWTSFLGEPPIQGPSPQYRALEERDLAEHQIVWLEPTWFNSTNAFAINGERAEELQLRRLSEMAEYIRSGEPGNVCVSAGYVEAEFGLQGLQEAYEFQVPEDRLRILEADAIYQATADGQECLFGQVVAGDARTAGLGLAVLSDNETYHPPFNASVAIRQQAYEPNTDIKRAFAPVAQRITDEVMAELKWKMAAEEKTPREVAREWLRTRGFIG